ncbi:hypothetical protein [Streptosporangium jomthongense]
MRPHETVNGGIRSSGDDQARYGLQLLRGDGEQALSIGGTQNDLNPETVSLAQQIQDDHADRVVGSRTGQTEAQSCGLDVDPRPVLTATDDQFIWDIDGERLPHEVGVGWRLLLPVRVRSQMSIAHGLDHRGRLGFRLDGYLGGGRWWNTAAATVKPRGGVGGAEFGRERHGDHTTERHLHGGEGLDETAGDGGAMDDLDAYGRIGVYGLDGCGAGGALWAAVRDDGIRDRQPGLMRSGSVKTCPPACALWALSFQIRSHRCGLPSLRAAIFHRVSPLLTTCIWSAISGVGSAREGSCTTAATGAADSSTEPDSERTFLGPTDSIA